MYIGFINTEETATEEKLYPDPPLSSMVQLFFILENREHWVRGIHYLIRHREMIVIVCQISRYAPILNMEVINN